MATGLILVYIVILAVLYLLGRNCWQPLFSVFRILFQGAVGALGIYLFNQVATLWQLELALNPFTALFTGLLGVPGLLGLLVLKYLVKV